MKKIILLLCLLGFIHKSEAQTDTLIVKTSSLCEMCKERIENFLSFEKGIISSNVNVETREAKVIYQHEKTTPEKIRTAITKSGYDADSLKADVKAFNKLPACCRDEKNHH